MEKLNTLNPEQIIYTNAYLELAVLGGVRLEGLDRMRVTIKVALPQSSRPPLRHNLDLYNDTQVEKLIRKTAERMEIGTSLVAGCIAELTEQLENYRLEQIKNKQPEGAIKKQLTEDETQAAKSFLIEENLLQRTNELIGKSGMIGEEQNRLLMYLIFTSRKRDQPLHVISLASSGTGKTHLQEKVGQLIPDEDRIEITTLSENAFYYFGQRELKNRLILIEDLDGAENVLYPMRELMSKKRISKTIAHKNTKGETKTITLCVEGPVSVAGCTTQETVYEDNANRSFLLYLDESAEQDEKIMQYQRALSAGKIDIAAEKNAQELLQNVQRILQPVTIKNPYAELLQLPLTVFKPRRTNAHYLAFIEAITFYKQYQRTQSVDQNTGEVYIETTLEDIEEANILLKETLLRKSDELSGACRNFFEQLKKYLTTRDTSPSGRPGGVIYTSHEIRSALRLPGTTFRRYQNELLNYGYVKIRSGKKAIGYQYEVLSYEEYQKLRAAIENVLGEMLQKIKELSGSERAGEPLVSHKESGAPKKRSSSKKAAGEPLNQEKGMPV